MTVSTTSESHVSLKPLSLPLWPLALFTLWDFYIAGLRPFDQLGTLAILMLIAGQSRRGLESERGGKILALAAASLVIILVGSFQHTDTWKPAIGMIEGLLMATIVATARWQKSDLLQLIKFLIIMHGAAEILQIAVFYTTHHAINYQAWLGAEIRTYAGNAFAIRPTGLFQEPAEICLMMFSLICLYRMLGGLSAKLELFTIVCLLLSLSLWGWGVSVFYVLVFRPRWFMSIAPFAIAIALYLLATTNLDDPNASLLTRVILKRIVYNNKDTSAQSRYGGLSDIDTNGWTFWFGQGLTNDYAIYGANGLSFLLAAGGVIGLAIFTLLWLLILPRKWKIKGTLSIFMMMTAMSQWTFVWWWVWIAVAACADEKSRYFLPNQDPDTSATLTQEAGLNWR